MVSDKKNWLYRTIIKRGIDIIASSILLVGLSPIFLIISIWIKLDSKGPVLFRQQRIGLKNKPFIILKFRSMKENTPDIATAEFENPECYITRSGKVLRKTSLDELPQLINVFKGEMSFIGPRPLISSEQVVLSLRKKNGADSVLPGITGLAQVNGRDEVSPKDKAKLDGKYAQNITFWSDLSICMKTILNILTHQGIHEGKQVN